MTIVLNNTNLNWCYNIPDTGYKIKINPELDRSPKGLCVVSVEQALSCNSTQREPVLRRLHITPLGFCLRVIVNERNTNLENTTFSVLSVILTDLWITQFKPIHWISSGIYMVVSFSRKFNNAIISHVKLILQLTFRHQHENPLILLWILYISLFSFFSVLTKLFEKS